MNKLLRDKILLSPMILVALIMFWGTATYRLYALNTTGVIIVACLVAVSFILYIFFYKNKDHNFIISIPNKTSFFTRPSVKTPALLSLTYLAVVGASFYILFSSQTSSALISPWQAAPFYFFFFYLLATALLMSIVWLRCKFCLILIVIHYFLSFSLALWVYGIGYGFDPFIHQATMELINKNGAVTPKPFYYLGQYSLVIFLHKITAISILWINKFLVPTLGALFLPFTFFLFLQKWFDDSRTNFLMALLVLIFPFSFLIMTTPQNLSYIFLIATILFGLSHPRARDMIVTGLLALATLSLHPLTGAPAVIFTTLLITYNSKMRTTIKKYAYIFIFILSSIALPLSFYILNTLQADKDISWHWQNIFPSLTDPVPVKENFILNFIYMYDRLLPVLIAILIVVGAVIAIKNRERCRILIICSITGLGFLLSYILTTQLSFNFVIEYEKGDYAGRILLAAVLLLSPFIIIALYSFLKRLSLQKRSIQIPFLLFIIILISTSLYLSYPRFDNYHNSHGYSISEQTLEAVNWIEDNSSGDYIVLANQQVGVSALLEFGFDRYYKHGAYFYPIPTSGKLYNYYLDMVYDKPSREVMQKATEYAGVNTGYFVLNEYWWAFPKILKEAELEADKVKEIGEGDIYIFKYNF